MTNQIANSVSSCTTPTGVAILTTFKYSPGTTSFGIGLGNFQSLNSPLYPITNHELFVNGVDLGSIESLDPSWTPGLGRNAYLVIDATGTTSITSVGFENITSEDVLEFDNHAVAPAASPATTPEPGTLPSVGVGALVLVSWAVFRFFRRTTCFDEQN